MWFIGLTVSVEQPSECLRTVQELFREVTVVCCCCCYVCMYLLVILDGFHGLEGWGRVKIGAEKWTMGRQYHLAHDRQRNNDASL